MYAYKISAIVIKKKPSIILLPHQNSSYFLIVINSHYSFSYILYFLFKNKLPNILPINNIFKFTYLTSLVNNNKLSNNKIIFLYCSPYNFSETFVVNERDPSFDERIPVLFLLSRIDISISFLVATCEIS